MYSFVVRCTFFLIFFLRCALLEPRFFEIIFDYCFVIAVVLLFVCVTALSIFLSLFLLLTFVEFIFFFTFHVVAMCDLHSFLQ